MRLTPRKAVQWVIIVALVMLFVTVYNRNNALNDQISKRNVAKINNVNDRHLLLSNNNDNIKVNYNNLRVNQNANERLKRSVNEFQQLTTARRNTKRQKSARKTSLNDIFISLKTTQKFHKTRLKILLDTWIPFAQSQTYIFTDAYDADIARKVDGHMINTSCPMEHNRQALCCKMAAEYDFYIESGKRWFCHIDDDTYLNTAALVTLLQSYPHTADWYLGRPSVSYPLEVLDRDNPGLKVAFWFATGGAGFCISRSLALKMIPLASGGRLMTVGEKIRLPDDCTIGYIIEHLLNHRLTVVDKFHSHLEALQLLKPSRLKTDISFSYSEYGDKVNTVKIPGSSFSLQHDPSRLLSLHCYLHPYLSQCSTLLPMPAR